jgi:hypothetical protein
MVGAEGGKIGLGRGVAAAGWGDLGEHAPWKGGPWCLEVSLPWRVATGRDEGLESERRGEKNSGDGVVISRLGRDQRGESQQKREEPGDQRVAGKSGGGQVAIDERNWDPERRGEKTK